LAYLRAVTARRRRALLLLALAAGCAAEAPPPSVLLVSIDTLRPDYLGRHGYDRDSSPFLDALLASGFHFPRAQSPIARTTPALASLLTGAYPHRTGVRTLMGVLADGAVPLAERLRAEGYQTLAVVSNTVLTRERRLGRGFDVYDPATNLRGAARTAERAIDTLAALDPGRPFFAWVHFVDPHVPYHPRRDLAEAFDPDYAGRYRFSFGYQPRDGEPRRLYRAWPDDLPKRVATLQNPLPERVNAHVRRLYAAEVRETDDALRELVAAFRAAAGGRLILIVTADHGESLGEHDFYYDHGEHVYDAETRVPLGIALPAGHPLRGPRRCEDWVSLVDVAPTLLELLGLAPGTMAPQLEGRSLVPCMRGEPQPPRPVFAEAGEAWYPELSRRRLRNDVAGRPRAVTWEGWKLVWTPFQGPDLAWELYDLEADPGETQNLYRPDHPRLAELRAALEAWMARAPRDEAEPPAPSAAEREALRELGYLEDE